MAFIIRHPIRKGVFLLVSLYAVLALLTLRAGDRSLYPAPSEKVAVYVINNGFHTDIALPADAVTAHGGLLAAAANHAGADSGAGKWLVYGWGDAGFFTGHGMSFGRVLDGLRALFHPGNPSVIRVFSVSMAPDRAYGKNTASRIFLTKDGFEAMASHIEASFAARNGAPVMTGLPSEAVFFDPARVQQLDVGPVSRRRIADSTDAGRQCVTARTGPALARRSKAGRLNSCEIQ